MSLTSFEVPTPSEALMRRYAVAGPRYTSYPTAPEWHDSFGAEAFGERLDAAAHMGEDAPLSLYVHLPFCKSLCWYCGCNVVISKEQGAADRYLDHLELELAMVAERLGARRSLSQIHWGGGTPTFLSEAQIERLWAAITRHFRPQADAEVAIEIHPALTTRSQLALLRRLGFNRLSMGLQDFDPLVQEATNRLQTPEQTRSLLDYGRSLGFGGVNFDLIYGLPHQNPERWARTLELVRGMAPDRLAVYSFAYMPDVLKHQKRMPAEALPVTRVKLDLFRSAYRSFVEAGYRPIGMDHFALPTDELARAQERRTLGRNFQGYTVKAAPDVVAVGSTGISDVGGAYAQNVRALPYYYERIAGGRFATERGLRLSADDQRRRALITQVMCNFWVDLGEDAPEYFAPELERLRAFEEDGLLVRDGTQLQLTALGRLFVRNVAMVFDSYLARAERPRFSQTV
ncbi:oxygen-independent coproporphyrinogen III oxidase [Aggregicoccus sp. 17bor-14]|uniref:oxygen-independent coproporphyrinogen III oxidase n=1 Tax=Myxococcaceae TaxID=31 RepID=UPI00129CA3EB|nr:MULTISPECIES: oxygen-independent coproporphyrinogen III oxidase [Myxococcaceae]MBF5045729.1 oxygen-independent coproporphyrinogen III oxidase [Simulacricoccus sp. 17bor-14]MRI91465.1 oxygen-independent coproporphyrinogen III oxidase [Aggregicoccus sp. 17bor-14]